MSSREALIGEINEEIMKKSIGRLQAIDWYWPHGKWVYTSMLFLEKLWEVARIGSSSFWVDRDGRVYLMKFDRPRWRYQKARRLRSFDQFSTEVLETILRQLR